MFEKLKQKKEEKKQLERKNALEKAKEHACSVVDTICLHTVSEDAIKVLRASQCCVNDEGGECNCADCPYKDDEECLSTLTDLAHKIAVFIGTHELAKRNATAIVMPGLGIEVVISDETD